VVTRESSSDVLPENPAGKFVSKARLLSEESTTFSAQSSTVSSQAEVLARASSEDEIGKGNSICDESVTGYLSDVVVDRDVGIVISEYCASLRIDFTTEHYFVTGAIESEIAAAAT
jgi:hypothetical protein